jgi:hypothetical protein
MSTLASSPALTSRVTPRKPWKLPKSANSGKRSSGYASANLASSPSYRSPREKGVYIPNTKPKSLIDRLSPTAYAGPRRRPKPISTPSPGKLLDKLMQSEALSAILSSGDEPTDAPVGIEHDAVDPAPTSADDNVDMVCPLVRLY